MDGYQNYNENANQQIKNITKFQADEQMQGTALGETDDVEIEPHDYNLFAMNDDFNNESNHLFSSS